MEKVHEFNGIWAFLVILSIIMMLSGMALSFYFFFKTWDITMSHKDLFLNNWIGVTIMIAGLLLFRLCVTVNKAK